MEGKPRVVFQHCVYKRGYLTESVLVPVEKEIAMHDFLLNVSDSYITLNDR